MSAAYVTVPVEPTEDMFIHGMDADCCGRPSADDETHVRSIWKAMLAAAPKPDAGWRPIAEAPIDTREMFVARAFNVSNGFTGGKPYTTDPWCVWRQDDGSFARWPHHFPPTHFLALPAAPTQEQKA